MVLVTATESRRVIYCTCRLQIPATIRKVAGIKIAATKRVKIFSIHDFFVVISIPLRLSVLIDVKIVYKIIDIFVKRSAVS